MPRKIWVEYPGAIYHIMGRGDRREDIFHDAFDEAGALLLGFEDIFLFHVLVSGNQPQNTIENSDPDGVVVRYGNSLSRGRFGLQNNVAPLLFHSM